MTDRDANTLPPDSVPDADRLPAPPPLPRVTDRDVADWRMVQHALAAMAEAQAAQARSIELLAGKLDANEAARKAEMSALSLLLNERFDALEQAQRDHRAYIDRLNEIVSGVRSAGESTFDMAKTCAASIESIREHFGIQDELHTQNTSSAPEAGVGRETSIPRPPRSIR